VTELADAAKCRLRLSSIIKKEEQCVDVQVVAVREEDMVYIEVLSGI